MTKGKDEDDEREIAYVEPVKVGRLFSGINNNSAINCSCKIGSLNHPHSDSNSNRNTNTIINSNSDRVREK